jgi:hypothetical protein
MPPETRSQDARRVDETTNPKHPRHMIKSNNNLTIPGLMLMYVSESLKKLWMPLFLIWTQHCRKLSSLQVSPTYLRPLGFPLQGIPLLDSIGPMKARPLNITYADQKENSLSLREKMSLNGFISVTTTSMLKKLLSKTSSN